MNTRKLVCAVLGVVIFAGLMGCQTTGTPEHKAQVRQDRDAVLAQGLSRLYSAQPSAERAVENAAGYAVFSNFGYKIFISGGGGGNGVAVNNRTNKKTYMNVMEITAGLGWGIKKYTLVFVFDTETALNNFVNSGWELGATAEGTARLADRGASLEGAFSVAPGVWLYQITEHGLMVDVVIKGAKFYKDEGLN